MEQRDSRVSQGPDPASADQLALDFVRFCYARRRVGWPELYHEMCAVAASGAFRGMGYGELAESGLRLCLGDLPPLAAIARRLSAEDDRAPGGREGHPVPTVRRLAGSPA